MAAFHCSSAYCVNAFPCAASGCGANHLALVLKLQRLNQAGELAGQLTAGDALAVLGAHLRRNRPTQATKAGAPVGFRFFIVSIAASRSFLLGAMAAAMSFIFIICAVWAARVSSRCFRAWLFSGMLIALSLRL
ncbi:hypothetical protein [Erwinia rhapontici]|uniref:hypothetical protein n=1 Tax=Erwinia rhapontici TaxID=55212 RepID=UPI0013313F05|nr:hypothetical protein [Erwinia rhapontici]MBP2153416.1 hypothetical protein [Erwinia rhapontici]